MLNLKDGKCDILVIEPESLTSGDGLQIAGIVQDFTSFLWTRKSNAPDEFELQVKSIPENIRLFTADRLIMLSDFYLNHVEWSSEIPGQGTVDFSEDFKYTDHVGIIESIDCKAPNENDYAGILTIKGRSLEALFERRIVWNPTDLMYYDGMDKITKYSDMINAVYKFLANDMIAPPLEGKKKKPDSTVFQNRAIWNIVLGTYGDADDPSNPYLDAAARSELHADTMFETGTQYVGNYEGTDLLSVIKNVCENYGLCVRTYLICDVPGWVFEEDVGDEILGLGRMNPLKDETKQATKDARGLNVDELEKISVIVVQFYVPNNRSFMNNESGNYVIFSQNVDNLKDVQFTKSYSQIRNVARIKGSDEKGENKIQYGLAINGEEEPTGWSRRESFVDAGDIEMEKTGSTYVKDIYIPALNEEGRKYLTEHSRNRNYVFDGTTIIGLEHDTYEYDTDYMVGDYVQFYDAIYDESIEVQITEIVESIDASDGYKMSASFENIINDFLNTDPLKYYYYTIDDVNKIITITGVKLSALMEDDVRDLGIIEFVAYAYSSKKIKRKVKKEINDGVVKEYETVNPYDEDKKRSIGIIYGTALNSLYNGPDLDTTKVDSFGITERFQDYSIRLNLIYSA